MFKNINLSKASLKKTAIDIISFKDPAHRLKNVSFTNIKMPENAKVVVSDAEKITFLKVQSESGAKPEYTVTNCAEIVY